MGERAGITDRGVKRCRKCGRDWPLSLFPEYRPGWRRGSCQPCINGQRSARRASDPDSADRVRSRQREADAERERLRTYERSAAGRAARKRKPSRQPDAVNAENRRRRAANREQARANGRRHARLRRLAYDRELAAWAEILAADPCAYCGGPASGVDHIDALAVGGENTAANFTGSCFGCNREKQARPLVLYLAERP